MNYNNRNKLIFFFFLIVNFLFASKYFIRFSAYGFVGSFAYIGAIIVLYYLLQKQNSRLCSSDLFFWGITFFYIVVHMVFFHYIRVEQLNVDRWSIITGFWHNVFDGKYPYGARSYMGNYPGPLPVYFLLTLPFYLVHEIGYFSLLGFIGFAWFIRKYLTSKDSAIVLLLLVSSVAMFWEISVRSTILVNAVLFLLYLHWLIHVDIRKTRYFLVSAILGGLLLSTRSIFVLVLVTYGVFILKNKRISFEKLFWWSTILLVTCIITFLPLLIFYFDEFLAINPILVQSDFLFPMVYVPILLCLAGMAGLVCKQTSDIFFWSGAVFFLVFLIYALRLCLIHGFVYAYLKSTIDLSYALFCFPFILFSLKNMKRDSK